MKNIMCPVTCVNPTRKRSIMWMTDQKLIFSMLASAWYESWTVVPNTVKMFCKLSDDRNPYFAHLSAQHELEVSNFAHIKSSIVHGFLDILHLHIEEALRVLVVLLDLLPVFIIHPIIIVIIVVLRILNLYLEPNLITRNKYFVFCILYL